MPLETDVRFLEMAPLLKLLGRQALRLLAVSTENQYVHGDETLFRVGDPADAGYVVKEGSFNLQARIDGREDVVAGPGTLLGELALITAIERPYTAIAIEPSTVVRIPRHLFTKTLQNYPEAARRLRDHIATRTGNTVKELQNVRAVLEGRHGAR